MIELLFAFTFWPWALVIAFVVVCGISAFTETTVWAIFSVVIFAGASFLIYDAGPIPWIFENPGKLIAFGAVYCAIGVLWSLFKWSKRMSRPDIKSDIADAKIRFLKENERGTDSEFFSGYHFPKKAHPSNNKDRITSWMALWPLSAFLYVFDDLLVQFFQNIYSLFSGMFERITKSSI